jgi:hypothetical protein
MAKIQTRAKPQRKARLNGPPGHAEKPHPGAARESTPRFGCVLKATRSERPRLLGSRLPEVPESTPQARFKPATPSTRPRPDPARSRRSLSLPEFVSLATAGAGNLPLRDGRLVGSQLVITS